MRFDVRPILSSLLRNRTGAVLVAFQIAISLAVLVNAVYIVKQRVQTIGRPDGLDTANIFTVSSHGFAQGYQHDATVRADLAWLNSQPDILAATVSGNIPLSGGGNSSEMFGQPGGKGERTPVNNFQVDEHGVAALGVQLSAGRSFTPEEIHASADNDSHSGPIILSAAAAREIFHQQNPLGRSVYSDTDGPFTVIGIISHMHGSWLSWDKLDHIALLPKITEGPSAIYIVRTKPGRVDATMPEVEEHLAKSNPSRVISRVRTLQYYKSQSYQNDRNMAIFLTVATGLLVAITALGIFGLATFNVSTRTRQIGTRRAIGARRSDIVSYFLVENWLITTAGVVVGALLALAVGYTLSVQLQLPRLDLYFLVGGIIVLWCVGLLAAWQPARRAATVSPAVATRSV